MYACESHALYEMCCKQFTTHIILVAAGLWHLGSLFYHNTQYSQRGCFTNLLWCDIPQNSAPQTGPHHIWCIYTPRLFLAVTIRQTAVHLCGWFRWPLFVMAIESQNIFCTHSWSYNQSGSGVVSGLSSFLNLQVCIQKFQDSACKQKYGYLGC